MADESPAALLIDEQGRFVGVPTNPLWVSHASGSSVRVDQVGVTGPVRVDAVGGTGPFRVDQVGVTGPVRVDSVGITGYVQATGPMGVTGLVSVVGAVGVTGPVRVDSVGGTGPFRVDQVGVTGPVRVDAVGVTGPVRVDRVGITGFVQATGPMGVTGLVEVVGAVGVTGPVRVDRTGITGFVQVTGPMGVQGLGTGGIPSGGVLSVQGISGAQPIPVYNVGPSGMVADVKAPNIGPTGFDRALVVVLSPNQQAIPVTTNPATSTPGIAAGTVVTAAVTLTAVRATTYNEPSADAQRSFSSANAADTSAGTGARQIRLTYYNSTGAGPLTETITLNGTTPVNTVASNICFVEKIEVISVGSGGVNAGIITMFNSTAGGGGTLATIAAGDNRTLWAQHYVPTGKTCSITSLSGHNTNSSNGSVLRLFSKVIGVANQPEVQISDFVRVGGGTSQPVRVYGSFIEVDGPARVLLYSACEGTASITTRASFEFFDQ